jgi:hypothetical protein
VNWIRTLAHEQPGEPDIVKLNACRAYERGREFWKTRPPERKGSFTRDLCLDERTGSEEPERCARSTKKKSWAIDSPTC